MGESNLMVHDFKEELNYSTEASQEPFWQAVYRKAFPEMVFAQICTEKCSGQYLGIDRVIHLKSGKTLYVDEKKRRKVRPDILLEYISVDKTNSPGWMERDLLIDYLAYAFMPTRKCYLLPWPQLRKIWIHFKNRWLKEYESVKAENNGYKTISVPIPIGVLLNQITASMIIEV